MLQVPGSSVRAVNRDATSTWEQCRGCEQRCYKYLGAVYGAGAVNRDATCTCEQCMVQGLRTEMLQVPGSSVWCRGCEQRCYKYLGAVYGAGAVNRDATSTWE